MVSVHRRTNNLQFAIRWQYRSAGRQWRTPTTHWNTGDYCCWIWHGNQLQQKQNSCQQHQAKTICQRMDKWKTTGRSGSVQTLRIHANQRWNINKGNKDQTGAAMTRLAILWKNKAISVSTKSRLEITGLDWSMDVRTGRWWWQIWRGKSRLLKTNATDGCFAYHTERA